MGKGDKKTRRGKIVIGSYGVRRPKKKGSFISAATSIKPEKPAKTSKVKAAAKPKAAITEIKAEEPVLNDTVDEAKKPEA